MLTTPARPASIISGRTVRHMRITPRTPTADTSSQAWVGIPVDGQLDPAREGPAIRRLELDTCHTPTLRAPYLIESNCAARVRLLDEATALLADLPVSSRGFPSKADECCRSSKLVPGKGVDLYRLHLGGDRATKFVCATCALPRSIANQSIRTAWLGGALQAETRYPT